MGRLAPASGQNRAVNARRITIAVGLTMLVESTLYQAVVPLLPSYADRFDLSKTGAGVVLAAYPLPAPVIGLLAGFLTPRIGGRRMALVGSALLTVSTIAFALAPERRSVLVGARDAAGHRGGHHLGGARWPGSRPTRRAIACRARPASSWASSPRAR